MKQAFTLAEVLVTLGIIGIVAALTIPMLAKNYQFYIRQQQFKKVYSELSVALQKTQISLGEGVKCFYVKDKIQTKAETGECKFFFDEFLKVLQIIQKCDKNALKKGCLPKTMRGGETVYAEVQGGKNPQSAKNEFIYSCHGFSGENLQKKTSVYVTNSGYIVIPFAWNNYRDRPNAFSPLFAVDINGHKGPNKWGHDIFIFLFNKDLEYASVFSLVGTTRCHPLDEGGYYTTHFIEYLYGRNAEL